ncbi:MAG: hypothetical protein GWP17_01570 [Aquificales bacterium]|nr:hypothetical protein [Aquificales bacterium]
MTRKSSRSVRVRRQEMQAKKKKQRLITAIIVVGSLIALTTIILLARQATRTVPEDVVLPEKLDAPPDADGRAWGPVDAPVVIEEYGDFQ